jgi:hypothetical protein
MGCAVIAAVLAALVVFFVAIYYCQQQQSKAVPGRPNDPLIENDALERGRAPRSDDLEGPGAGIASQMNDSPESEDGAH